MFEESTAMEEVIEGVSMAMREAGLWDAFLNLCLREFRLAFRQGLVEPEESEHPFDWMFPEDFDERSQVLFENARLSLWVDSMKLLGRDLIAEQNPGRSQGFIEFIKETLEEDPDGTRYSRKRWGDFSQAVGECDAKKQKTLVDGLWASFEKIGGGDFSHPEADAEVDRLTSLAQAAGRRRIDHRAKRVRQKLCPTK